MKEMLSFQDITWCWRLIRHRRGKYWALVLLSVWKGVAPALSPFITKMIIDAALSRAIPMFWDSIWLMLAFLGVNTIVGYLSGILAFRFMNLCRIDLQQSHIATVFAKPYEAIDQMTQGEWITLLQSDAGVIARQIAYLGPQAVMIVVRIIALLIALLLFNTLYALILLAASLIAMLVMLWLRKKVMPLHYEARKSEEGVSSLLQEIFVNSAMIRVFDMLKNIRHRLREQQENLMNKYDRKNKIHVAAATAFSSSNQLVYFVALIWGGIGIMQGRLSYGSMMAIAQLTSRIQGTAVDITALFPNLYTLVTSISRMRAADERESPDARVYDVSKTLEALEFKDVSFGYHGACLLLSRLSFRVDRPGVLGIKGETGKGKTTLLKLMLGLYQPNEGSIRLILRSQEALDVFHSRGAFGYVSQSFQLFSGSLGDNIAAFCEDIPTETIRQAAKDACIHDFIMGLPEGYDTLIQEYHQGLSQGQAQRVAIARALANPAPIIIFDEATSALDSKIEQKVLQNITRDNRRILIFVSHRPEVWGLCGTVYTLSDQGALIPGP